MSTTEAPERRYRIAEVGRLTGFTPTTLRFYENEGVLGPPARTEAGYRLYTDRDVERLRLISRAKELGCTLEEIAGLVQAWDDDQCGPVKHRLRALVTSKVTEVQEHIASQVAFAAQLQATAAGLSDRPVDGPCDDTCGCASPAPTPPTSVPAAAVCASSCDFAASTADAAPVPLVSKPADDEPPIACSLGAAGMEAREAEWRAVLGDVVDRADVPEGLRLTFGPNPPVGEIARLVEAEVACCSFFRMNVSFDRHGVTLEVTAPVDGQPLLATLFGVAA